MNTSKKIGRVVYFAALTVDAFRWPDTQGIKRGPNLLMLDVYASIDHPVFSFETFCEAVTDILESQRIERAALGMVA